MEGFKLLLKEDIEKSLNGVSRQYLVGHLKKPQKLLHIDDENVEIGITKYTERTDEPPHYHTIATEYQYMLSGTTTYYNLDTGEEATYKQGDFYVIYPNTKYAQKSSPDTAILFIKIPSVNDKQTCNLSKEVEDWYRK
ncbi:MAG: cupin domain-containing protein [Clostridiales bacterium]|nr:cupin domain-containing protein [Clostridiales bacterium]